MTDLAVNEVTRKLYVSDADRGTVYAAGARSGQVAVLGVHHLSVVNGNTWQQGSDDPVAQRGLVRISGVADGAVSLHDALTVVRDLRPVQR